MPNLKNLKTTGTTTFGRYGQGDHLFRVNPDIPIALALEYASNLLKCANTLALDIAMGEGSAQAAWSAWYLGEMAKALTDDVSQALAEHGVD